MTKYIGDHSSMLEVVYVELLNGYLGGGGGELDNFLMQVCVCGGGGGGGGRRTRQFFNAGKLRPRF